jgi:hypothetical protein
MTFSKLTETGVWPSNVVAAGAVASPVWLPSLQTVSEAAAMWAPIIGIVWLVLQIGFFLYGKLKK